MKSQEQRTIERRLLSYANTLQQWFTRIEAAVAAGERVDEATITDIREEFVVAKYKETAKASGKVVCYLPMSFDAAMERVTGVKVDGAEVLLTTDKVECGNNFRQQYHFRRELGSWKLALTDKPGEHPEYLSLHYALQEIQVWANTTWETKLVFNIGL